MFIKIEYSSATNETWFWPPMKWWLRNNKWVKIHLKNAKRVSISKTRSKRDTTKYALRRALRSENNHGRHIEGSFQTEVLKTSHFRLKGPSVWRISTGKGTTDGHFGLPWSFAQILSTMTAPPCGHGMMTQKGTSRNSCLVPHTLHHFEAITQEQGRRQKIFRGGGLGLISDSYQTKLHREKKTEVVSNSFKCIQNKGT